MPASIADPGRLCLAGFRHGSSGDRHTSRLRDLTREIAEHNAAVDKLAADFHAGAPDAVEEYFEQVLAQSAYPDQFPHDYEIAYRPEL